MTEVNVDCLAESSNIFKRHKLNIYKNAVDFEVKQTLYKFFNKHIVKDEGVLIMSNLF